MCTEFQSEWCAIWFISKESANVPWIILQRNPKITTLREFSNGIGESLCVHRLSVTYIFRSIWFYRIVNDSFPIFGRDYKLGPSSRWGLGTSHGNSRHGCWMEQCRTNRKKNNWTITGVVWQILSWREHTKPIIWVYLTGYVCHLAERSNYLMISFLSLQLIHVIISTRPAPLWTTQTKQVSQQDRNFHYTLLASP